MNSESLQRGEGGRPDPVRFDALELFHRVVEPAQLFERLTAVIIGCGVIRIERQQGFVLLDGLFETSRIGVLHRQAVARKAVGWILRDHRFQDLESVHNPMLHAC